MKARELQLFADELLPPGLAWEWNQVMMDFGARQCGVRIPLCDSCPVKKQCRFKGIGDDPAATSAGVSKPQARFEGSDRQARGRAIRVVADGVTHVEAVIEAMKVVPERGAALINALCDEGLLRRTGEQLTLP